MRHPAYQLRPNKAVDRFFLVEAIRRLAQLEDLSEYTYFGLGGPYLEDFRLLYERFPEIALVSVERKDAVFRRQRFHLPCGTLKLRRSDVRSFVGAYSAKDRKSIFWLDYTGLDYGNFEDFMTLLGKVAEGSMIKITLRCEPRSYIDARSEAVGGRAEEFVRRFGGIMPDATAPPPRTPEGFACLLRDMLQVAALKALPSAFPFMFQPISSFYYSDGTYMFTLTGIVCRRDVAEEVRQVFGGLPFCNLDWAAPQEIDLPILSTKERLHLEQFLPCDEDAGRTLQQALGYQVDADRRKSEKRLKKYADFHRFYPYFMRAVP